MRLNVFLAKHTDLSRRKADTAITEGRVEINGVTAKLGDTVIDSDVVSLDSHVITPDSVTRTILLYKPIGYVCSRAGQGSMTVYDLLPAELQSLNSVGRLDKDSSGLLVMTNDGTLANELTHPRYGKVKRYEATLDKPLAPLHQQMINDHGIQLEDGPSRLTLMSLDESKLRWEVKMSEGRNRQIRRTFYALGYRVERLHRTHFGDYSLGDIKEGEHKVI